MTNATLDTSAHLTFVTTVRCVAITFKELIGDHPVAVKLEQPIEAIWLRFLDLHGHADAMYRQVINRFGNKIGF